MILEAAQDRCHGTPTVPGTRLPVYLLAAAAQAGMGREEIQRQWQVPADWLAASWEDLLKVEPCKLGSPHREHYGRYVEDWALDEALK